MNLRLHLLSSSLVSLLVAVVASAAQDDGESGTPFNCHISYSDLNFDLTGLAGQHTLTRTRQTPPTTTIDTLIFNLCEDLQPQDGVDDADQVSASVVYFCLPVYSPRACNVFKQCPPYTRACLTMTNQKEGAGDRITAVIPLGNSSADAAKYAAVPGMNRLIIYRILCLFDVAYDIAPHKGLSLTLEGAAYPDPSDPDKLIPQSFHLSLSCSTQTSDPKFVSYDGKKAEVEWSAPSGCPGGSPPGSDQPKEDEDVPGGDSGNSDEKSVGSGIGYFFLL